MNRIGPAGGDLSSMLALVARTRERGGAVVFTNGVFDLIHPGHIRYLQSARRLGVVLMRDPYDAALLAPGVVGLTAYGWRRCQLEAVIARLTFP